MKKHTALAIIMVAAVIVSAALTGCSGDYANTPGNIITPKPSYVTGDEPITEAPNNTSDISSEAPGTTGGVEIIFDLYTVESFIPVIKALMEGCSLKAGAVFPPAEINDELAISYLYSYAQANTYVADIGATLSDFEVNELLDMAFNGAYSYERFITAVNSGGTNIVAADNAWNFGLGESYSPTVRYAGSTDEEFDANNTYVYSYESVFGDSAGTVSVRFAVTSGNMSGFAIAGIVIEETP